MVITRSFPRLRVCDYLKAGEVVSAFDLSASSFSPALQAGHGGPVVCAELGLDPVPSAGDAVRGSVAGERERVAEDEVQVAVSVVHAVLRVPCHFSLLQIEHLLEHLKQQKIRLRKSRCDSR